MPENPTELPAGEADEELPPTDTTDRDELLALIDDAIRQAHDKITNGRVRDAEKEKARVQWLRALGYLAGQYRALLKDRDLEALAERVAEIEEEHASVRVDR